MRAIKGAARCAFERTRGRIPDSSPRHRGINCLATPGAVRSIAGLVKLAAE